MTAIASLKERPPVVRPPPQKPVPQGKGGRKRRGSCLGGLSCLGGSPLADTDTGLTIAGGRSRASWFTWSRFRKKKKTVPVDASSTELLPEKIIASSNDLQRPQAGEDGPPAVGNWAYGAKQEEATVKPLRRGPVTTMKPSPAAAVPRQGCFWGLRKSSMDGAHHQVQKADSQKYRVSASLQEEELHRLPSISPKFDVSRAGPPGPAPSLCRRICPSRYATAPAAPRRHSALASSPSASPARAKPPPGASRLHGARPHRKSEDRPPVKPCPPNARKNDQVAGLSVLAVVLVVLVMFGRVSAIVFTCAWFYILPRLRGAAASEAGGRGWGETASAAVADYYDSEEYKKRVVLEGLLQRDGRRASGFA